MADLPAEGSGAQYREARRQPAASMAARRWTASGPVDGLTEAQEPRMIVGRGEARIADPLPMGLAAFAAATWTASAVLAGWFDVSELIVAIPILFVFGGVAQFIAGMWAYARSNILATVAFCSFGAFNVLFAVLLWMQTTHVIGPISGPGVKGTAGMTVLMFGVISGYLAFAAMGDNRMIALILLVLAIAYVLDGIGLWVGGFNIVGAIGGYAGLIAALLAFYESAAIVFDSAVGREVFPTFSVMKRAA